MSDAPNYIKVRDDKKPIAFDSAGDGFTLRAGQETSWVSNDAFTQKDLRSRIEPWLTSLFQSEHLSLLAGSGLTHAVHILAAGGVAAGMGALPLGEDHKEKINQAAKISSDNAGRKEGNLEDQLRVANELLRGLQILQRTGEASALQAELDAGMAAFCPLNLEK